MTKANSRPATEADHSRARQGRIVAVVIALTMVLWLGLNYAGAQLNWPFRFALLIDFAAIAALLWSLIVAYWIWKAQRQDGR